MKNLFHPNSPFMILLQKVSDLFLVNLCFLLCCIPVFTIGAAATAMYAVYFRSADDYGACRLFFREFKAAFKQSTAVWLIILAAGAVLYLDFHFLDMLSGNNSVVRYILYMACFTLFGICCYVFPLMARYRNTVFGMMKNALILSISMLPKTIVMMLITAFPCLVLIVSTDLFGRMFMLWLLIGFSVTAKVNSMILDDIFSQKAITCPAQNEGSAAV